MGKVTHIVEGWAKRLGLLSVSDPNKKLSDLRLKICGFCRHSKPSKVLEIMNGAANYRETLQCAKCLCPCLEKTLVIDEKCPDNQW